MKAKLQTAERCSQNDASDNVIFQRHLFAYEQAAAMVSGKIAEAGCGEGYGMQVVLPSVELYLAMDKYQTNVAHEQTEKVIFKQMNFPDFAGVPVNFFDFIICFQVIEHIQNDRIFVERVAQLLKKGGKLLLTTPHAPMSITRNPFHVREYEYNEMKNLLTPYFSQLDIKGVFGKEKASEYYEANKKSVARFRKFDPFDFEHRLPASFLKVPYDLLNRWNRAMLLKKNSAQTVSVTSTDFYIDTFSPTALDLFVIAEKC